MAEEDLASQEAEDGALEEGAVVEEAQEDPVANLAAELGWKPKDQWQGDPEAWKEPAEFLRAGRDIQQSTSRELKAMREQMDRLSGVTTQIVSDKVAERDAWWQAQFDQAVEDGDKEKAGKLLEQRQQAPQRNGPDPQVAAWVAKNPWYSSDPLAAARAQEISDRLQHLPVSDQLTQVDRAIRKEFPEHFPAPAKQPAATQTGQNRNANPGNRVKGFADMPRESQQMALDYEKRLGVKKETFAQSYWADQERVKR